jgi:hypothetical protein
MGSSKQKRRERQEHAELKSLAMNFSAAARSNRALVDKLAKGLKDNVLEFKDFGTEGLVYLAVLSVDHLQLRIWEAIAVRADVTIYQLNYLKLMARVPKVKDGVEGLRLNLIRQMRGSSRPESLLAVSANG